MNSAAVQHPVTPLLSEAILNLTRQSDERNGQFNDEEKTHCPMDPIIAAHLPENSLGRHASPMTVPQPPPLTTRGLSAIVTAAVAAIPIACNEETATVT